MLSIILMNLQIIPLEIPSGNLKHGLWICYCSITIQETLLFWGSKTTNQDLFCLRHSASKETLLFGGEKCCVTATLCFGGKNEWKLFNLPVYNRKLTFYWAWSRRQHVIISHNSQVSNRQQGRLFSQVLGSRPLLFLFVAWLNRYPWHNAFSQTDLKIHYFNEIKLGTR